MALYGLQGMSSEHLEVRSLLVVLTGKTMDCQQKFNAQAVSNALYGLQSMSSEHPEVRSLLGVLTGKLEAFEGKLTAQNVGNAMYGLQGMSSEHPEVRSLLVVLVGKLEGFEGKLTAPSVGNALYGLQGMSSEHVEVRSLLVVLADEVAGCQQILTAEQGVLALRGLQGMNRKYPEVEKLLDALAGKMIGLREMLKARAPGTMQQMLQNKSSEYGRGSVEGNDGRDKARGVTVAQSLSKDSGALFLFASNNDNPTQAEVDAYFRENPDSDPEQVISILQRTVKWKKKKAIDVLTGDNLPIVMSSLQRMLPKLNRPQLRHAAIGTLECLQVIPLVDIEKSGSCHSFVWCLLS